MKEKKTELVDRKRLTVKEMISDREGLFTTVKYFNIMFHILHKKIYVLFLIISLEETIIFIDLM